MAKEFIVAVKLENYLVRFDAAQPVTTQTPSYAEHMAYREADRQALYLRARGFQDAHVCTIDGMPATLQSIVDAQETAEDWLVMFRGIFYFAGPGANGDPLGSRNILNAKSVSRRAANEICARLRRMGFQDARVIENPAVSAFEEELKRVWGPNPSPAEIHYKK